MVAEKFSAAGTSVWDHVVVGYSKCNQHDVSWRSGLANKRTAMQAAIRQKIPSCEVDVPVIALGGASIEPPLPSHTSDDAGGFESLWQILTAAPPLDTTNLQPFEGADVKWQKIVNAKDQAEARAKAALIYIAVLLKIAALLIFLFWRAFFLPQIVAMTLAAACVGCGAWAFTAAVKQPGGSTQGSLIIFAAAALMMNLPGVLDEIAILGLFARWVGPTDVMYSVTHFYEVWVQKHVQPHLDTVRRLVEPYVSKAKKQD